MSAPRVQNGHVFEHNNAFHVRFYIHENGKRKQKSRKLCNKDAEHPTKTSHSVLTLAEHWMLQINLANTFNDEQPFHLCICGQRCSRTLEGTFAPSVKQQ
jgi:hypothetical protein